MFLTTAFLDTKGTIFYTEKCARKFYGKRFNPALLQTVKIDYNGNIVNY